MMLHTFTYDSISSATVGLYVLNSNTSNSPARNVEFSAVQGRNGNILTDFGSYSDIEISYEVILRPRFGMTLQEQIDSVKAFLYKKKATYRDLSDSYNPTTHRSAVFVGPIDWEKTLLMYGKANIIFHCKPQIYNGSGTIQISAISANSYGDISLADAIESRKATDYLDLTPIQVVLSGETGVSGNIIIQTTNAVKPAKIKLNFGSETIDLIDTTVVFDSVNQNIYQRHSINYESLNSKITQMFGAWFIGLDFDTANTGYLHIENNTNKDITGGQITWRRWTI